MKHQRKILFRGFSTNAKKWVYGLLTHQAPKRSIITDRNGVMWNCYSSSIGQHIGGRALSEGDGWHWAALMDDGTIKTISKNDEKVQQFGWMKENGASSLHPVNNGPELYEGDIVSAKFTNGKRNSKKELFTERVNCLIIFDHANLQWRLQRLQYGRGYMNYFGSDLGWDIKLIGNATEHPHLLIDEPAKGKHVGALNVLGKLVHQRV